VTAMRPVRAAFFDLDGTLVDSEIHTDRAISVITARHGVPDFALPHSDTRGRTWLHVAERIRVLTKMDAPADRLAEGPASADLRRGRCRDADRPSVNRPHIRC